MEKTEGKRSVGRPRRRWEDNIEMDLQEMRLGGMAWTGSLCLMDRNICEPDNEFKFPIKCWKFLD